MIRRHFFAVSILFFGAALGLPGQNTPAVDSNPAFE
jgi:hypothetical protein